MSRVQCHSIRVSMGFTEFYWVLLGFTEFLEVSLGGRDIKRQRLAVDASFVGKNGFFSN